MSADPMIDDFRTLVLDYPCGYEQNGNDIIHNHAMHHFDGDELGGWIIPLLDVWCLRTRCSPTSTSPRGPVDHFPVPPDVLKFFHRTGRRPDRHVPVR
jgi:hypothetical protein